MYGATTWKFRQQLQKERIGIITGELKGFLSDIVEYGKVRFRKLSMV